MTDEQEIRALALGLAIQVGNTWRSNLEDYLERAEEFARWIRGGDTPDDGAAGTPSGSFLDVLRVWDEAGKRYRQAGEGGPA